MEVGHTSQSRAETDGIDVAISTMKDRFRPLLLELDIRGLLPSQPDKLLQFFRQNGITELGGLSIFDPMILWEKRRDCAIFESETFCLKLGFMCHNLFLGRGTHHIGFDTGDYDDFVYQYYRKVISESAEIDISKPSCFEELSFFTSWVVLVMIFQDTSLHSLARDAEVRRRWQQNGVLQILKKFPLLAAKKYNMPFANYRIVCRLYPYYFFLVAGFERGIVQQVQSYYPKATERVTDVLQNLYTESYNSPNYNRISVRTLRFLLDLHPELAYARTRHGVCLLEWLFSYSATLEELKLVRSLLPKEITTFRAKSRGFEMPWENDICRVRVLESIVPQLRELTVGVDWQAADCCIHFFHFLSNHEHTKLETLIINFPVVLVATNEDVKSAVELFLEKKPVHLKKLKFENLWDIPRERCGPCWEAVSNGIAKGEWHLEELSFWSFICPNATQALFSKNLIESLDFQMVEKRHLLAVPWGASGSTKDFRIGQLSIHQDHEDDFSDDEWAGVWQAISKGSKIENVLFAPSDDAFEPLERARIVKVFETLPMLPNLKTICIGPYAGEVTISTTAPLISILAHGCLEFLQVEGSCVDDEGDVYACKAYSVKADDFCQALINNKSLQFLFLRGIELEGPDVAKSFLNVLEKHNNTTIEFMDICDDKHFYTVMPKESWRRETRHGFSYENYALAWRVYYLTCFNRYGRGKVRAKNTTAKELVKLLQELHPGTGLESHEKEVYPMLLKISETDDDGSSESHLTDLYELLRSSPESWYNVIRRDIEVLSLRYDLLRERPCLWCGSALEGSFSGRKRKSLA